MNCAQVEINGQYLKLNESHLQTLFPDRSDYCVASPLFDLEAHSATVMDGVVLRSNKEWDKVRLRLDALDDGEAEGKLKRLFKATSVDVRVENGFIKFPSELVSLFFSSGIGELQVLVDEPKIIIKAIKEER